MKILNMRTVESEAFKVPDRYSTLAISYLFKDDVREAGDFAELPQLAQQLGFTRIAEIPTKKAAWQVFDRPNHSVPNFPDGTTRISSTLAIYDTQGELTHAVLRTSPESYPTEEFGKDLENITKHFIERPRLLGYPSQELTKVRNVFLALAAGVTIGSAADYYVVHSMGESILNAGTIIGELAGPTAYGILWAHAERHARRSISHPEQYVTGRMAKGTLESERYHIIEVAVQRELYETLQQEGIALTPDQFLDKIYGQIPAALVSQRHTEIQQIQYPRLDTPREIGNSHPKLVEVAHVLQQVEIYLQITHQLRQGLSQ